MAVDGQALTVAFQSKKVSLDFSKLLGHFSLNAYYFKLKLCQLNGLNTGLSCERLGLVSLGVFGVSFYIFSFLSQFG